MALVLVVIVAVGLFPDVAIALVRDIATSVARMWVGLISASSAAI